MSDSQFWSFYFQLVDIALPPERERDAALLLALEEGTADASAAVGTTARGGGAAGAAKGGAGEAASAVFGSLLSKTQSLLGSAYQQATAGAGGAAGGDALPAGGQEGGAAGGAGKAGSVPPVPAGSLLTPKDAAAADRQGARPGGLLPRCLVLAPPLAGCFGLNKVPRAHVCSCAGVAGEALHSPTSSAGVAGLRTPPPAPAGARDHAAAHPQQGGDEAGAGGRQGPPEDDEEEEEEAGAADTSSEPLGELEDDPELAAYLQVPRGVGVGGGGAADARGHAQGELVRVREPGTLSRVLRVSGGVGGGRGRRRGRRGGRGGRGAEWAGVGGRGPGRLHQRAGELLGRGWGVQSTQACWVPLAEWPTTLRGRAVGAHCERRTPSWRLGRKAKRLLPPSRDERCVLGWARGAFL